MTSSFAFWIEPRPVELKCTSYHIRTATGISRKLQIQKGYRRVAWIVRPKVENSAAIRADFELVADEAAVNPFEIKGP